MLDIRITRKTAGVLNYVVMFILYVSKVFKTEKLFGLVDYFIESLIAFKQEQYDLDIEPAVHNMEDKELRKFLSSAEFYRTQFAEMFKETRE